MPDLRDDLQAAIGASYTIERELAGGGMSRVFVALDRSLNRRVVVKVLPPEMSGGVSIDRFRREVALAAQLQHPHIVPLFAAGEAAGSPYYTMPYVEGESLRATLARGALPIGTTISVLRDVARALVYAHEHGVAHRDIKPDNVLLAGASAVITDFGIAKALSAAATGARLTSTGVALGTPAYMAPEQAAADPAADVRADLYAFGVMAYEMLAGQPPFAGSSAQAVFAAHATETPRPIAALRPATPPLLADVVMQCLEKNPADRPQSASAVLLALDGIVTTDGRAIERNARRKSPLFRRFSARVVMGLAGIAAIIVGALLWVRDRGSMRDSDELHSIAVVPFENTSGDTAFAYLEDGITDRVRDVLNGVPGLSVKARSSSRQAKGRDAREIGSKLGVGVVLQGAVSRSSSRLHVTAELVRASDDNAIWSGTFERQPNELAAMQDTIANAVAARLRGVAGKNVGRGTSDADAYDLFLRGRYAVDRFDLTRAMNLFQAAIARDPRFARAYAYLAMTYGNVPVLGIDALGPAMNAASVNSAKALALDSTVVEAYIAQSFVAVADMRLTDALRPLERALAIDSSSADLLWAYAFALDQAGRLPEALVFARRAQRADPLSATALGILGYTLSSAGRYPEAIATFRNVLDLDSNIVIVHRALGFAYAFDGKPDSAVAEFEAAARLGSATFGGRSNLLFGYAAAGRWEDANKQRDLITRESAGNSPNYFRTIVNLVYGDYDSAMTALERGVTARDALLTNISIACDPLFDPLHSNPRFEALMRRLGARACPVVGKWPIGAPLASIHRL